MDKLNTHNPEYFTWKYEQLLFAVLGGVQIEGLDRMRVTLKIEHLQQTVRHNLDLYNDTQVEKLTRKTAERLEIGASYMGKAIGALTGELENYRLAEMSRQTKAKETRKLLTAEEKEAATRFLQQPDLLQATGEQIGKSGVVGEELNRLLMYLIFTSRKTNRPLHLVSFGSSGVGKSHLQEKVGELIPEEDKIEITSLSGNAFYYFDKEELGHKLVLIEDLDGALAAFYPIRELQSKQKITKTVTVKDRKGNAKTIHLVVYGPVSISGCTTQERIYEDNANRSFLIYLDESAEQDEKVMHYQRLLSAGKINSDQEKEVKTLMQNCQRMLQPLKVRNPYAEYLKIPAEVFKPRRTNAHYIAFIEAITFYHQYQRRWTDETTGEIIYEPGTSKTPPSGDCGAIIETTLEDIAEANALMKHILLRKSDELGGGCRNYFEELKKYLKGRQKAAAPPKPSPEGRALKEVSPTGGDLEGAGALFSNKEVREALRTNHNTQKMYMAELQQYGYIRRGQGDKKKGFGYEVNSYEEYEQLESRISNVLDDILHQLKAQQLEEVVKPLQPLKTQPAPKNKAINKEVVKK